MELRHLRCLVAVADERHFTRAAQRLHIAQPALSQQIRRLEQEVGLELVDRTTRTVRMTDAGETLVRHARRILHEADVAAAELEELRGLGRGRLSIGASQTMGAVDLSALLAHFHAEFPAIELAVHEDLSVSLAGALRRDELDLAFITTTGEDDGLESQPLASEPLVCALPPGHRLSRQAKLDVGDLEGDTFIAFRRGATIRQRVEAAAESRGFSPRVGFETNDLTRMRALVSAGLGVAVLPHSDASRAGPEVVGVPFDDPALVHTVVIGWRAGRRHSPATRAFLRVTRSLTAARHAIS
jgi:LysR family transcriptional regulator, transcription activator of glutamate synthase operon